MVPTISKAVNMKSKLTFIIAAAGILAAMPAVAALSVFACEPEWGALAQELGGDKVSVYSATTALQDPHRIEARPSLIARVRTADLVVCTGSDLEVGWLPVLLGQAGNAKVRPGTPGFLEASQLVVKIEVPRIVDRSLGDIHPGGNPHIHTDPRNLAKVATALTERLILLDPAGADAYKAHAGSFQERWRVAMQRWEQQAAPLRGMPIVVYHKDMSYLINWLGLREAGTLEPKPGIPPSPSQLAELVQRMQREPAKAVVYSAYNDPRAAQFLSERARIPAVMLPYTVGGTNGAKDLFGLFDDTLARLLAVAK
jgi:zinc/manganese transport system substrate-binding protein